MTDILAAGHPAGTEKLAPALLAGYRDFVRRYGPWDVFTTLTFDRERRPRSGPPGARRGEPSRRKAEGSLEWWLRQVRRRLGRRPRALAAVERHADGVIHFHTLLRVPRGVSDEELDFMARAWWASTGNAKIERAGDQAAVSAYVSKRFAYGPEDGDFLFWPEEWGKHLGRSRPRRRAAALNRLVAAT